MRRRAGRLGLTVAQRGWMLLGAALLLAALVESSGLGSPVLAFVSPVVMSIGLVMALSPLIRGGLDPAGARVRARPVPASGEYYETFGG